MSPTGIVRLPLPAGRFARSVVRRGFAYDDDSDTMDLTIGSFDHPSHFVPKHHFGVERLLEAWLDTSSLPRYRTDEHKPLIERWINSLGKLTD